MWYFSLQLFGCKSFIITFQSVRFEGKLCFIILCVLHPPFSLMQLCFEIYLWNTLYVNIFTYFYWMILTPRNFRVNWNELDFTLVELKQNRYHREGLFEKKFCPLYAVILVFILHHCNQLMVLQHSTSCTDVHCTVLDWFTCPCASQSSWQLSSGWSVILLTCLRELLSLHF